jgi:hypothetical protein
MSFRFDIALSQSRVIMASIAGLARELVETSSYDSPRLMVSASLPLLVAEYSRSMGNVAMKLVMEPGVLGSVSEERDTEWKEDMEDAGACPEPALRESVSSLSGG